MNFEDNNIFYNIINNTDTINDKVCLISNEPLDDNSICLDCNHVFNYFYLYNEVIKQKTKKIGTDRYLQNNEIKCPYCRSITKNYLPYFKYYNVKNYSLYTKNDICNNLQANCYTCQHISKKNGKCNNLACKTTIGCFCNKHLQYTQDDEETINNIDNNEKKYYTKMKNDKLKEILKLNKCFVSGNKKDLVLRILCNKNKYGVLWKE
tara:strand:- start:877 stop:1497 length:621 start_codon:yes stop_codon:yes gene_type:complete